MTHTQTHTRTQPFIVKDISACSPVFKDILKKDKNSSPILYLRGIQFSELESIIQFIYLGEAKFCGERMHKPLALLRLLYVEPVVRAEHSTPALSCTSLRNGSGSGNWREGG